MLCRSFSLARALGIERIWGQHLQFGSAPQRLVCQDSQMEKAFFRIVPDKTYIGADVDGWSLSSAVPSLYQFLPSLAILPNFKCSFKDLTINLTKERLVLYFLIAILSPLFCDFVSILAKVLRRQVSP